LSASLSVGKARTFEKADENIKTLLANLNVTIAPVQVREHIESLKLYQTEAADGKTCFYQIIFQKFVLISADIAAGNQLINKLRVPSAHERETLP